MPPASQATQKSILAEFQVAPQWLQECYPAFDEEAPFDRGLLTTVLTAWTKFRREEEDAASLCLAAIRCSPQVCSGSPNPPVLAEAT